MKAYKLAFTCLLAALSGLAAAHHGRLQDHTLRGTILDYGIYRTASAAFQQRVTHAAGAPAGIELVEATAILPARAGIRFGFCVSVTGVLEDGELDLVKVVSHPPLFTGDGRVTTGYEQEIELIAAGGEATACIGHALESEFAALPGRWTIALMAADQVVAAQVFELR
jgi:hypothetical protein